MGKATLSGKYAAYPEYKNAKSKWLDVIPLHWDRTPIKHVVAIRITDGPHETPKFVDEGVPFLSAEAVKNNTLDFSKKRGYITQLLHDVYSQKCSPKIDDVFMVKSGNTTGNLAIVETEIEFNIWSPLALIRADTSKVLPRFIFYSMLSDFFRASVELSWSQGTQPNIGMGVIENLHIAAVPLDEQKTVIGFLDHEIAKIDILIEKQQELIKLLKEKRQAVISHAVTKGLNPNAPMRDSGVEWLGEVPKEWEVLPLKYAITFQRGHDLPAQNRIVGDVPLVTSAGISSSHNVAVAKAPGLVTGRYGTIGKFNLVVEDYWPLNTTLYSINLRGNKPKYLWYMLHNLQPIFIANSLKSAVPGVDRNDLHTVKVAITKDHDEQDALCDCLDAINQRYDVVTERAVEQINLLQERRTALISAAVTGKIDVRDWQAA